MAFKTVFSNDTVINIVIICSIALAGLLAILAFVLFIRSRGWCCFSVNRASRAGSAHFYHTLGGDPSAAINSSGSGIAGAGGTSRRFMPSSGPPPPANSGRVQAGAADLEDYLTNLVGTMDDRFQRRNSQQPLRSRQTSMNHGGGPTYRNITDRDALIGETDDADATRAVQQQQQHLDTPGLSSGVAYPPPGSHSNLSNDPGAVAPQFDAVGDRPPSEEEQIKIAERHVVAWLDAVHKATAHLSLCDLEPPVFEITAQSYESFQSGGSLGSLQSRHSVVSVAASNSPRYPPSASSALHTPRVSEGGGGTASAYE